MSALDALVKQHLNNVCKEIDKSNCAFVKDLAQLRASLATAQTQLSAVQSEREQLDWEWHDTLKRLATAQQRIANQADSLKAWAALWEHIERTLGMIDEPTTEAFSAMLQAHDTAQAERIAALEQAAAIEQARDIISRGAQMWTGSKYGKGGFNLMCQKWIAAHPAPASPVKCLCVCICDSIATKQDEHGTALCESCYNDYYGIVKA